MAFGVTVDWVPVAVVFTVCRYEDDGFEFGAGLLDAGAGFRAPLMVPDFVYGNGGNALNEGVGG